MEIGRCRFDRLEISGSLGDLGTLLPIAVSLVLINGLSAMGVFLCVGLFYLAGGWFYRVPIAVQPMKVIGGYAIAMGASSLEIQSASLLMGILLGVVGLTGTINRIAELIPKPVIRGVQASTGLLLTMQGVRCIAGTSPFQQTMHSAEPFLMLDTVLGIPLSLVLGAIFLVLALWYLNSKKAPGGLVIVGLGALTGLALGAGADMPAPGLFHGPELMPYGWPSIASLATAMVVMVLPQLPMTIGNAVIANADLSNDYFPHGSDRVTPRNLCLSMACANVVSFALGGMPMCHGAGGLAAHYRFGARTSGSNFIIGGFFVAICLLWGENLVGVLQVLPIAVLGVLLTFAGLQLAMTVMDVQGRRGMFTVFLMVAVTMTFNLAIAFIVGFALMSLLKYKKIDI